MEMTLEQKKALALARARVKAAGNQPKEATPEVKQQQEEAVERMSGGIPELLVAPRPEGTGVTLGEKVMEPQNIRLGLELGGMALGGMGAPSLLARAPQAFSFLNRISKTSPLLTQFLTRAPGAAMGGAAGSLAAETVDPTERPFVRAGESALFGFTGEGVGSALAKGGAMITPKLRQGADIAQRELQKFGGTLTKGEASLPGLGTQFAEGVGRSGYSGRGVFKTLDEINENAIQSAKNELLNSISTVRPGDERTGKLFVRAIESGKKAHAEASTVRYAALDAESGIPVDVSPVRNYFVTLGENLKKIGDVGKTDRGGKLIDQLSKVEPNLTFKEAHELRSSLLATSRDLKASGQESLALRNVNEAITKVETAMESAAQKVGGDFYQRYQSTNNFYKRGKKAFTNDVTSKLMETNPERIGEYLFRSGNVSEVTQAKASLRQAARQNPSLDWKATFQKMKAGYLDAKLTGKGMTNVEAETVAKNFLKDLSEKKFDRTMKAMFSEPEMKKIQDFAITAMRVSSKKGDVSEFGVIVPIAQVVALTDVLYFKFATPEQDAAVIIAPYVLARMVTNPKSVNKLIRAMTTKPSTKEGAILATELSLELNRLEKETSQEAQ